MGNKTANRHCPLGNLSYIDGGGTSVDVLWTSGVLKIENGHEFLSFLLLTVKQSARPYCNKLGEWSLRHTVNSSKSY